MKRKLLLITFVLFFAALIAGCVDRDRLKSDLTDALGRHTEMNNYSFSGNARLAIDPPDGGFSENPLSASLLALLMNSQIEWSGVASVHPVQVEADIRITPHASSSSYHIPLLIKDNKMYIHIPAINTANQFVELDFQAISELSGKPDNAPQKLGESGKLFSAIAKDLVAAIDTQYFDEQESPDDADMRVIEASIDKKQSNEANRIWSESMTSAIGKLAEAGYLNNDHASNWLIPSDRLQLDSPLVVSAAIDAQGFVRKIKAHVDITVQADNNQSRKMEINLENRYADINANPAFTREVPSQIVSFTEILKLISGNP